jgi:hypothetical protein
MSIEGILYDLFMDAVGVLYAFAVLVSRLWDTVLGLGVLGLCGWAAWKRDASPKESRSCLLLAAAISIFLYLPPFGGRIERPDLAVYFEPEIPHTPPSFIAGNDAVYVQMRLERMVSPLFAETYVQTLERRGIEIDATGTSPYAPLPHPTGWTIRGVREVATDPYTVEHFTSYVRGTSFPARLRWPWLYLRLGPDFFGSFQRSVVIPKKDGAPVEVGPWRYPGAVITLFDQHDADLFARFLASAREDQVFDYYTTLLEGRYRQERRDGYRASFARKSASPLDLSPPSVRLTVSQNVWYFRGEAPSIYTTEGAERRRRVPPAPTEARRSQQSVLLPNLPLLTQYELSLVYPENASGRYGFARTFEPENSRRLDRVAVRKGLPFGDLPSELDRSRWLNAADVGLSDSGDFKQAVEQASNESLVVLRNQESHLPDGLRVVIVPPEQAYFFSASTLGQFADDGGVVACFRQNMASGYEVVPRPAGSNLAIRGSKESKSHYGGAARVDRFHPILSSVRAPAFSMLIDGVIRDQPRDSMVLLRSVVDGDAPALVLYRMGKGWVAVGPLFAFNDQEYGAPWKTQLGGFQIVRDLITWAKDPERPIPVAGPGERIALSIEISNRSKERAGAAKLRTWAPSRDRVLDTRDVPLSLPPDGRGCVRYEWDVPPDAPLGIHHVDYELLDERGRSLQPESETASGRFAVAIRDLRQLGR